MTATTENRLERFTPLALLMAGLLVAVIGLLDLFGWLLDIPLLTSWEVGTLQMAPAAAVLFIMFGAALCLGTLMPQGRIALLISILLGGMGFMTSLLLFALRLSGAYSPGELLGLHIIGTFRGIPRGHISLSTAFCLLLSYGSLLASLPSGVLQSWRSWLMLGFGGLVSFVGFVFLLAYAFGIPLIFGNVTIPSALSTSLSLLIIGLAQLVLAARYIGRQVVSADADGLRLLPYLLVFLVFVVGSFVVAYHFYRETELRFRHEVESELLTMSELKTDELVRWRRERLWDGTLTQNAAMTASVRQLLETPHNEFAQREMQDLLGKYQRFIGYDGAFLLDAKGVTRMSVPYTSEPVAAILAERAAASLRMGQVMLQDFYRDERDQRVYLAVMVPIIDKDDGNRPLGVVVLRIDPNIYLYPHILRWPIPTSSAETLIVRREGNDVLFLNNLRFGGKLALTLRLPLNSNAKLPAVKAVMGQLGIVEGLDYRGVPVIAAVRNVPDSPWYIVNRMDIAEVYAHLRERIWLTFLLVSVLVCGAGAVLILLWRQQRMAFYQRQHELTSALRESHERFEFALQKIHIGGWELNLNDNTAKCTQEHFHIFGYKSVLPEWTYEIFLEHVLPEDRPEVDRLFREALAAHSDWNFECRIIRRYDHQVRWIWAVGGHVRSGDGGKGRMAGIVQDITERKQAEERLHLANERFRRFVESNIVGIVISTFDGAVLEANDYYLNLVGYSRQELEEGIVDWRAITPPEYRSADEKAIRELREQGVCAPYEKEYIRRDGTKVPVFLTSAKLPGPGEQIASFFLDITERKQAEEKLHLAASVFTHAREGIMITNAEGTIIDVNDAFCDITGYNRDEVIGRNPHHLSSGLQDKEFYEAMWRDLIEQGHWHGEVWNQHKNGDLYAVMQTISAVRDEQGSTRDYVALLTDITPLKEHEQKLERSAHFDVLTGLPNRVLLSDRLQQGMVQARRRGQGLAVAFLDLDGFKAINDNHGHEAGDQLLIALAARMKQALREGDTIARLGGDEFVAVLADIGDIEACALMLNRLLAAAAEPMQVGESTLQVSASLGVTFYSLAEDIDADHLLRQADQAMYQAKMAGKNRYHLFDADQDSRVRSRYESLERIRLALSAREFVLYYQPKVNMRTGAVIGAEALIRWQHPEKGLLSPNQFLPAIEDHQLGIELGEWVIDTALIQMENWQAAGLNIPVSINVGAHQLQHADFVERLRALLAAHPNVRPEDLELEVLETSALEDLAKVSQVIDACRRLGVSFALDDFGTGYSSLIYLKHLPVSQLKIDQSFVRDMIDDPDDLSIVEGVIGLANAFRLLVIAEGAETIEHSSILLQLGCDLAQGYGIARPMPANQLPDWLSTWQPDPVWAGLPAFSHDDMPLLLASVEHRAWIVAIEKYLKGEREVLPQMDPRLCRFSTWLNAEGPARHGTQPAFQSTEMLHSQSHALAAELCELQAQGRKQEALARLDELHGLRDALFEQLKVLVKEIRY